MSGLPWLEWSNIGENSIKLWPMECKDVISSPGTFLNKEGYSYMGNEWLVLYDGYCNLCSHTVQWIIRNKGRRKFSFLPLHEAEELPLELSEGDSVLLVNHGRVYDRSGAALRIACGLRFPWPLLGILLVVPRFLRDPVYSLVARNRKRWFGVRATCYRP